MAKKYTEEYRVKGLNSDKVLNGSTTSKLTKLLGAKLIKG